MKMEQKPTPKQLDQACVAICKSGKFETGQGTCALICMDQLGSARSRPCHHAVRVHGDFATAILQSDQQQAERIAELEGIVKRVQSAAKTIMIGEADELARLREEKRADWQASKSLDSEREMNAILTAENERLEVQQAELLRHTEAMAGALAQVNEAIKEMFRYYDGGETRGSYDGKPERNQLRKAGYACPGPLYAYRQYQEGRKDG